MERKTLRTLDHTELEAGSFYKSVIALRDREVLYKEAIFFNTSQNNREETPIEELSSSHPRKLFNLYIKN